MKVKSYTNIEQSRKLAEILPLESADMCYIQDKPNIGFLQEEYKEFGDTILQDYYPCWSLSALLNALPNNCGVNKEEDNFVASYLISDECGAYTKTNPIDACVEMIIHLHEDKML